MPGVKSKNFHLRKANAISKFPTLRFLRKTTDKPLKYTCTAENCDNNNAHEGDGLFFVRIPQVDPKSSQSAQNKARDIRQRYLRILWDDPYKYKPKSEIEAEINNNLKTEYYVCSHHLKPDSWSGTERRNLKPGFDPFTHAEKDAILAARERAAIASVQNERGDRISNREESDISKDAKIQMLESALERIQLENADLREQACHCFSLVFLPLIFRQWLCTVLFQNIYFCECASTWPGHFIRYIRLPADQRLLRCNQRLLGRRT
jgi:hypothetical protein